MSPSSRFFQPSRTCLGVYYIRYYFNLKSGFLWFNVVVLHTKWPWSFYGGILNRSFVTNFQYGHFLHIDFNTLHFWYGIIFNKCTSCNLITSAKTFAFLSRDTFWYFVGVVPCIVSAPFLVKIIICSWCHIYFSHYPWTHRFTSWLYPGFMYLYI